MPGRDMAAVQTGKGGLRGRQRGKRGKGEGKVSDLCLRGGRRRRRLGIHGRRRRRDQFQIHFVVVIIVFDLDLDFDIIIPRG